MRGAAFLLVALVVAGCTLPADPLAPRPYLSDVLRPEPYTRIVVEIDHAPGYAPSEAAKAHIVHTLRNVTGKQVDLLVTPSLLAEKRAWDADALVRLEREQRNTAHDPPRAVIHVLYPAGSYANGSAAGVTISGVVLGPVVVFLDALREIHVSLEDRPLPPLGNPQPAIEVMERAVLLHEVGHAIGLVDNGLPMMRDHKDEERGAHSDNEESVMWYALESTAGLRQLLLQDGSVPDRFDADDLADVAAERARE